jgi:transcriptional regulator with XRE-family HTH domain
MKNKSSGPRALIRLKKSELQEIRRNLELTYPELAEEADLSISTVQRALSGDGVSIESARRLAAALGIDADITEFEASTNPPGSYDVGAGYRFAENTFDVQKVFGLLIEMSEKFADTYEHINGANIVVNQIYMYEACIISSEQIGRLNSFHVNAGGSYIKSLRTGAIICCEISRHKPLWIDFSDEARESEFDSIARASLTVNELFGLNVAMAYADIRADNISRRMMELLIEHLKRGANFRSVSLALEAIKG